MVRVRREGVRKRECEKGGCVRVRGSVRIVCEGKQGV